MKKLLLLFAVLLGTVGVFAQVNYGKRTWTFPATSHEAVSEVPAEIFEDFKESYKVETKDPETGEVTSTTYTELTNEKVGVFVTDVRVATEGNVTAAFVYNDGNIRMDISGVDLVNASGEVVYSDYHFGYSGGNKVDNVYTLTGVAVGDYTMRMFIPAQKEDITSATANDSRGVLTITGAWMYPNEGVYYNIKNVRSNKYVTFKGEGKQFTQESANNGAGSYWHFVEASLDDVKKWNNAWLVDGAIPAGVKPYWVYSAACEKGVENVTNGYMASPSMDETYPAKIYYIGVHTKDDKTGLIFRPCHEDGSSWNDAGGNGTALGYYTSNDAGSLWSIELANVADNDLIAMGTTAKSDALATVASYEQAYYFNPTAAQVNAVTTAINAIDCSTMVKSLMSVIEGVAAEKAAELASCITAPKAGDRFMMKNVGRSGNNYLRAYAEGDVKCSDFANDLNALDLVWTLVDSGTDGFFKLYNERHDVYVGALSTSNNTRMQYTRDVDVAGLYEISQTGVYTLFHAKGQDGTGYMHQSNWGGKEIVRWDNGDCSQWQLIKAPIELTTNIENPICYAIKSGRDGNYYFTLENNKIKLINNADIVGNDNAKWFFMLDANKNLKIYPYADKANTMGYITIADGNTKLTNDHSAEGFVADTYTLYYNTNNAANNNGKCFAFRPTEGNTFVSNHGGTGNYMGFYNENNDKGTRIGFENISKAELASKVATWEQYLANEGDKVCQYVIVDDVKTVVNDAAIVVATKSSNDAAYKATVQELNALTFPSINVPQVGNFYRLKNGASGWYATSDLRTDEAQYANKLYMSENGTKANTIWYVGANNALLSYTKGQYLGDMSTDWSFEAVGSNGNTTTFVQGATIGKIQIKPSSGRSLYGDQVRVDAAGEANKSGNYEWTIEEVTSLPVTITAAKYATFYSPVAVTLPEDLQAFYVSETTGNYAKMTEITDVIPANTGVILMGEPNTYNLTIGSSDVEVENELRGTVASEYITTESYVLSKQDDVVGFYKAAMNKTVGETPAFLNNGFKAYLPKPAGSNSRFFVFDFGGTETAIENVEGTENTADAVVYDLAGRRVQNAQKGVFIVNGKVVIK